MAALGYTTVRDHHGGKKDWMDAGLPVERTPEDDSSGTPRTPCNERRGRWSMEAVLGTYPSWSLLIVRVVLGAIMFAHGAQKVFGWFGGSGLKGTIGYFQQALRIPPALTVLAALTECFGGLAVLVVLLARPAALGIIAVMLVAMTKVHLPHGFFLNWSLEQGKGHGIEMNLALIGMALAVLVGGGGALSVDRMIAPW